MTLTELILMALGLSMDAFSVSVCKGLALRRTGPGQMAAVGAWFGGFQALMPVLGYLLGARLSSRIARYGPWIILILLSILGAGMIREALDGTASPADAALAPRSMLPLALATSIDALAVGVTFSLLDVRILPATCLIGAVTFALSALGVKAGSLFGLRCRAGAGAAGGALLILLGLKILLTHLGIL